MMSAEAGPNTNTITINREPINEPVGIEAGPEVITAKAFDATKGALREFPTGIEADPVTIETDQGAAEPGEFKKKIDNLGRRTRNAVKIFAATLALSSMGAALETGPLQAESAQAQASISSVNTHGKKHIALTFDDGPGPITQEVLNILSRNHVKATFYMVGKNVLAHKKMALKVKAAGHEIGNHTMTHPHLTDLPSQDPGHLENGVKVPGKGVSQEIFDGAKTIKETLGIWPALFREPVGLGRNDPRIIRAVRYWGETSVVWSNSFEQAFIHNSTTGGAVNWLVRHARPGTIELAHDGGLWDNRKTVHALNRYIVRMKHLGFHFVKNSQLLKEGAPHY